ncbi:Hypothetical predicted protein [Lecanosticta acicola]|uniref:Uncharacterized protein n=1 Tax=Lecanosticta acicola TaxID=111012 RepID=A0AAI9EAD5_9PEZI|nr:Hypothetical predicted protein [Lecanosticta acicola]
MDAVGRFFGRIRQRFQEPSDRDPRTPAKKSPSISSSRRGRRSIIKKQTHTPQWRKTPPHQLRLPSGPRTIRTRMREITAIYAAKTKTAIKKKATPRTTAPYERLFRTPGSLMRNRKLGKLFENLGTTVKTTEIEACAAAHDADTLLELFQEAKRRSRLKRAGSRCDPAALAEVANRVFGVAELCEMVLCRLPPRDIIVTRRVNRAFEETFEGSRGLRRITFQPASADLHLEGRLVSLNTMMFRRTLKAPGTEDGDECVWLKIIGFRAGSRMELRGEDLVGRMVLTQPPVRRVEVVLEYTTDYGRINPVENERGVTVQEVLKATRYRSLRMGYKATSAWVKLPDSVELV